MQTDDLLIEPVHLQKLRRKLEQKSRHRKKAELILFPRRKKPWWKRLFAKS